MENLIKIIPPPSLATPEAEEDKLKYESLRNNVRMMKTEHAKLSRHAQAKFGVDKNKLDMAKLCLENANKTFNEYHNFLKEQKYRSWNASNEAKLNSEESINNCFDDLYALPNKYFYDGTILQKENASVQNEKIHDLPGKIIHRSRDNRKRPANRHKLSDSEFPQEKIKNVSKKTFPSQKFVQLKCQLDSGSERSPNYDCPRNRVYNSWYQILPHMFYSHMESLYNLAVKTGQIFLTCPHNDPISGSKCASNYFTKARYCPDKPFDEQLAIRLFALSKHIEKQHTGEQRLNECPDCMEPILGRHIGDQEGWQLVQYWMHLSTHLEEYKNHPPGAVLALPARMSYRGSLQCAHGCEYMFNSSYDYITHLLVFHWTSISEKSMSSRTIHLFCPAKDGCRFEVRRGIGQNLEVEGGLALTEMFDHLRKWHVEDEMAPDHCPRCFMSSQFMQDCQFWQHLAQHSDIETYFCESCQVFVSRKQMDYHFQVCTHPGIGLYVEMENRRKMEVKKQLKELGVLQSVTGYGAFAKQIQKGKDMKELERTNMKKATKLKLQTEKGALRKELILKKELASKKEKKKINRKLNELEKETSIVELETKPTNSSSNGVEEVNVDVNAFVNLCRKESTECNSAQNLTQPEMCKRCEQLVPNMADHEPNCKGENVTCELCTRRVPKMFLGEHGPRCRGKSCACGCKINDGNHVTKKMFNHLIKCKPFIRLPLVEKQKIPRKAITIAEVYVKTENATYRVTTTSMTNGKPLRYAATCFVNEKLVTVEDVTGPNGLLEKFKKRVSDINAGKSNVDRRRIKAKTTNVKNLQKCPTQSLDYKILDTAGRSHKLTCRKMDAEMFEVSLKSKQLSEQHSSFRKAKNALTENLPGVKFKQTKVECKNDREIMKKLNQLFKLSKRGKITPKMKRKPKMSKIPTQNVDYEVMDATGVPYKISCRKIDAKNYEASLNGEQLGERFESIRKAKNALIEKFPGVKFHHNKITDKNDLLVQRRLDDMYKLPTREEITPVPSYKSYYPKEEFKVLVPPISKGNSFSYRGAFRKLSELQENCVNLEPSTEPRLQNNGHEEKFPNVGSNEPRLQNNDLQEKFPNIDAENKTGHINTGALQKDSQKKIQVNHITDPDVTRFTCDHCGTHFSQERILNFHMAMHIQR